MKRKRGFKFEYARKRARYVGSYSGGAAARRRRRGRRYRYKSRALRTIISAHETARRYFNTGQMIFNTGRPGINDLTKALYQPFNWMGQGTTDSQIIGNAVFIRSVMLKGTIVAYPTAGTVRYAGPLNIHFYLMAARDEVSTGAIAEGFTESSSTVNGWFSGSTTPSQWFPNKSYAQVLYHKKLQYIPVQENAFDANGALIASGMPSKAMNFFCKKSINKMHYFKESDAGGLSSGLFGRNRNYYWLIAVDQPLGFNSVSVAITATHLMTWKDV